jgi:hypothetical protein
MKKHGVKVVLKRGLIYDKNQLLALPLNRQNLTINK